MAGRDDFAEPLLSPAEVVELCTRIEAGLLARAVRLSGSGFADASPAELLAVEDLGEQSRQRFIRANLRLVATVSRPAAVRSAQY